MSNKDDKIQFLSNKKKKTKSKPSDGIKIRYNIDNFGKKGCEEEKISPLMNDLILPYRMGGKRCY